MKMKHIFFVMLSLLLILSPQAFAAGLSLDRAEFADLILQAGNLARKGEWNRSEKAFLKVTASPILDQRIEAYEGLVSLYTRLRLSKKAQKIQIRLDREKRFRARLVPQGENDYEIYTLQAGDSYAKIAVRKQISLEWLKRANEEKILIPGKTIRVPRLPYHLMVNRENKTLQWRRGDEVLKVYPVAVGKKGTETPLGDYEIISKVKNPVWYHLNLEIPPESPQNLLGPRWMGLNLKGYGIHGTRNPKSINYAVSHGCVRMHNRDVEELFEWMSVGTKVQILQEEPKAAKLDTAPA